MTLPPSVAELASAFIDYFQTVANQPPFGALVPFAIYEKNDSFDGAGYIEVLETGAFGTGHTHDIGEVMGIPGFVGNLADEIISLGSPPVEAAGNPLSTSVRMAVRKPSGVVTVLEPGLSNGFSFDPETGQLRFTNVSLLTNDQVGLSYVTWVMPGAREQDRWWFS